MALLTRRAAIGTAAALAATRPVLAQAPAPKSPLSITVVDVAGNLALTQKAFENYRKAKPAMVERFIFTKAPAPELPAKLRAQQAANRVDIDMVLTGTDALAAGIDQKIWAELLPAHADQLPKLESVLLEPAWKMQGLAQQQAVVISYYPSGPLLEYMPDQVKTPPTTAEELLAFTKSNPNRFMYARPANSGPGRTFLMGLPYILGDSDPKDPVKGWDKTWAFLNELDKGVEYYPTGTAATMKELGEGSRDIIVSTTGWDINPRVLGIVPKEAKVASLRGFHWVVDAHYAAIPKGLGPERMAVLLDIISFLLTPAQQAYAYDEGFFYPGPAVKDVTLSMAPPESQKAIGEFGRPEYERLIADVPREMPLDADKMVLAFRRWDEQIGAKKDEVTIQPRPFRELRLDALGRDFGSLNALRDINLTIKQGEFIALLGPSGCGKSTTLNCIAGLLSATSGAIWLDDQRIDTLRPEQRGFGMVFQNYALFPHMTVRKNIGFGLMMRGAKRADLDRRVAEAVALVRLQGQEHKLPGQLSGGQQQRVAIARAIVVEPPLVLMDEPLSNLDAKLRLEMRAEIRRIHASLNSTTIYVTHDQEEALSLADRIVVLKDGTIRQVGTPAELFAEPADRDVAEFMGFRNAIPGRVERVEHGVAVLQSSAGSISGLARETLAAGSPAVLVVRPEDLMAEPGGVLTATVVSTEFRGHGYTGFARMADGTELVFTAPDSAAPGSEVHLAAHPDRALVYKT